MHAKRTSNMTILHDSGFGMRSMSRLERFDGPFHRSIMTRALKNAATQLTTDAAFRRQILELITTTALPWPANHTPDAYTSDDVATQLWRVPTSPLPQAELLLALADVVCHC
jgi:hypothetical protein